MAENRDERLQEIHGILDSHGSSLNAIIEAQKTQIGLLEKILKAATDPSAEVSPVVVALHKLAAAISENTIQFGHLRNEMQTLPNKLGETVAAKLQAVIAAI